MENIFNVILMTVLLSTTVIGADYDELKGNVTKNSKDLESLKSGSARSVKHMKGIADLANSNLEFGKVNNRNIIAVNKEVEANTKKVESIESAVANNYMKSMENEGEISGIKKDLDKSISEVNEALYEDSSRGSKGEVKLRAEVNKERIRSNGDKINSVGEVAKNAKEVAEKVKKDTGENSEKIEDNKKGINNNKSTIAKNNKSIENNDASISENRQVIHNNSRRISNLEGKVSSMENEMNKGFAMSAAMASMDFQVLEVGELGLGLGVGNYQNAEAVSLGLGLRASESLSVNMKGAMSTGKDQETMIGAGAVYKLRVLGS